MSKNIQNPFNEFLFEAAEPDTTEPDGTNEPVEQPADDPSADETSPEDQPDPSLAQDIAGDNSDLDTKIETLQKELDELQKKYDLENEVNLLKRRLDNLNIVDDTNLNDSLNQSAKLEIKFVKRAIRRIKSKIIKEGNLSSSQQNKIILELETNPQLTSQEIAAKLSSDIKAKEQDIFDFIRNSDFRFRHRHRRLRDSN